MSERINDISADLKRIAEKLEKEKQFKSLMGSETKDRIMNLLGLPVHQLSVSEELINEAGKRVLIDSLSRARESIFFKGTSWLKDPGRKADLEEDRLDDPTQALVYANRYGLSFNDENGTHFSASADLHPDADYLDVPWYLSLISNKLPSSEAEVDLTFFRPEVSDSEIVGLKYELRIEYGQGVEYLRGPLPLDGMTDEEYRIIKFGLDKVIN